MHSEQQYLIQFDDDHIEYTALTVFARPNLDTELDEIGRVESTHEEVAEDFAHAMIRNYLAQHYTEGEWVWSRNGFQYLYAGAWQSWRNHWVIAYFS